MRVGIFALLLSCVPLVSGFAPSFSSRHVNNRAPSTSSVLMAALSSAEDLELTRKVIMDHIASADVDSEGVVDDNDDDAGEVVGEKTEEATSSVPPKAEKKEDAKNKAPQQQPAGDQEIDISKLNILVGGINKAWQHEEADKLFCEEIDVGELEGPRQIASGLRAYYKTEDLVGRKVLVLANLKSRKLMGFPSHGMVLCASSDDGSKVAFVDPPEDAVIGERVMCEGYDGELAAENQVIKKKMLDAIFPDLRTDSNGVASFKGVPLKAGSGNCVAPGMGDAQVA